jgi:hypothetical protein
MPALKKGTYNFIGDFNQSTAKGRILVSAGFATTVPSGSEQKGLGGELALEPFATAAIALGPFDLIGEVSYTWTFKPEHAQAFDSGLAAAWPVSDGSPRSSSSAQPRPPSPRTTGPRSPSSPA